MPRVTIIDYGMGNLLCVARALEYCGTEVLVTSSPESIRHAERLILPGVGAFADGMAGLQERELIDPIREYAHTGRPFLGICLGMQMMLDSSLEFGTYTGLGLIPGAVEPIPATDLDGCPHKIPHIGWNNLYYSATATTWENTILADLSPASAVYFVHSYTAVPMQNECRLADCKYGGRIISAVIRSGSLYGCQFHPEKSGEIGLSILKKFISLS
jgi:glutamine amidotransferase